MGKIAVNFVQIGGIRIFYEDDLHDVLNVGIIKCFFAQEAAMCLKLLNCSSQRDQNFASSRRT